MRYWNWPAAAIVSLALVSPALGANRVVDYLPPAWEAARGWQKDAVLIEVSVVAAADGSIQPANGPLTSLTFVFASPGAGADKGLDVTLQAGGRLVAAANELRLG